MNAYQRWLARRLELFRRVGRIPQIPTQFQVASGELEMLPYVLSPDATEERRYRYGALGNPIVRQAVILREIGTDHLDPGTGLRARLASVIRHLQFTHHQGMPVWDLQVLQTHAGGLDAFRRETVRLLSGDTPDARRRMTRLRTVLRDPIDYLERFLGDDGWIARADRMDYAAPDGEGSAFPIEFFSLVDFMEHCARKHPAHAKDLSPLRVPAHFVAQITRRARERRPEWSAG
jgi:hypothetical protein